ncbi:MAG: hypothetical protein EA412_06320, partial [Chitinophagaceae bacterium]
ETNRKKELGIKTGKLADPCKEVESRKFIKSERNKVEFYGKIMRENMLRKSQEPKFQEPNTQEKVGTMQFMEKL